MNAGMRASACYFSCMVVVILFFGLFVEFGYGSSTLTKAGEEGPTRTFIKNHYPLFTDLHVMVFVGFGFLWCFLKSYNWSAIGYNYLIACYAILIEILWSHFWNEVMLQYDDPGRGFFKLNFNIQIMIEADYGAASCLIAMGAVLGKCSIF
jgi:ammonium transporter Rh